MERLPWNLIPAGVQSWQIDKIVLSDHSYCNLFHLNMYMAMKDTVEGLEQSPVDYYHITAQTCVKQ